MLDGEAYFAVSHDTARPFTVRSGAMSTTVLGTEFNISAYSNEPAIKTTLISGSVEVAVDGITGTKILSPSTRAQWVEGDSAIDVRTVNTLAETSWRRGIMLLDETGLDEIMRTLARWYDVEVEYCGDTVANHNFTGRLDRQDDLRTILEKLTLLGAPRFEIEDNRVIVH
jgi:ferric-dicitrate binding protein FerR (iron transport regulator)